MSSKYKEFGDLLQDKDCKISINYEHKVAFVYLKASKLWWLFLSRRFEKKLRNSLPDFQIDLWSK